MNTILGVGLLFLFFTPTQAVIAPQEPKIEATATISSKDEIVAIITQSALKYGVDPEFALKVVNCESGFNPQIIGDGGQSRGLWQIHRPSHPLVSDEVVFDPVMSTEWAMPKLLDTPTMWTCAKMVGT